jgi:hemerythrin-like metal-binding protein
MPLQWNEFLLTGNYEIDEQHMELFTVVNAFVQAIIDERDKEEVDKLFKFLDEYTVMSFGGEEKMLETEGYPDLSIHKAQHAYFKRTFSALKRRYDMLGHSEQLVKDTHRDVANWLLNHVAKTDQQWAAFIKNKKAGYKTAPGHAPVTHPKPASPTPAQPQKAAPAQPAAKPAVQPAQQPKTAATPLTPKPEQTQPYQPKPIVPPLTPRPAAQPDKPAPRPGTGPAQNPQQKPPQGKP